MNNMDTTNQSPLDQPATHVPGASIPVAPPTPQSSELTIALNEQSAIHKDQMDGLASKFEASSRKANRWITRKTCIVGVVGVAVGVAAYAVGDYVLGGGS